MGGGNAIGKVAAKHSENQLLYMGLGDVFKSEDLYRI